MNFSKVFVHKQKLFKNGALSALTTRQYEHENYNRDLGFSKSVIGAHKGIWKVFEITKKSEKRKCKTT